MGRCGCAGGCGCVIEAHPDCPNVNVQGTGSPANPYQICVAEPEGAVPCVSRRFYSGTTIVAPGSFVDIDFAALAEADANGTGFTAVTDGLLINDDQFVTWAGSLSYTAPTPPNAIDFEVFDDDSAFNNRFQFTPSNSSEVRVSFGGGYFFPGAGNKLHVTVRHFEVDDMPIYLLLGITGITFALCPPPA